MIVARLLQILSRNVEFNLELLHFLGLEFVAVAGDDSLRLGQLEKKGSWKQKVAGTGGKIPNVHPPITFNQNIKIYEKSWQVNN